MLLVINHGTHQSTCEIYALDIHSMTRSFVGGARRRDRIKEAIFANAFGPSISIKLPSIYLIHIPLNLEAGYLVN